MQINFVTLNFVIVCSNGGRFLFPSQLEVDVFTHAHKYTKQTAFKMMLSNRVKYSFEQKIEEMKIRLEFEIQKFII